MSGLKRLGVSMSARDVKALITTLDEDDYISREVFGRVFGLDALPQQALAALQQVHDALYLTRLTVRDLFAAADGDGDGRVSSDELASALEAKQRQGEVLARDSEAYRPKGPASSSGPSLSKFMPEDAPGLLARLCESTSKTHSLTCAVHPAPGC